MPRPSDGIEMRDTEFGERPSTVDGRNDTSAPTQERGGGRSLRAVATAVVAANRLADGRPRGQITQERGSGRSLRAVATAVVAANRLTDGRLGQVI